MSIHPSELRQFIIPRNSLQTSFRGFMSFRSTPCRFELRGRGIPPCLLTGRPAPSIKGSRFYYTEGVPVSGLMCLCPLTQYGLAKLERHRDHDTLSSPWKGEMFPLHQWRICEAHKLLVILLCLIFYIYIISKISQKIK